jgi:tRNA(Ile)-lysidine synthetase-like protein
MAGTRRLNELGESARGRLTLPEGSLVVALSGGADSAALAWLCVRAEREVRAVHVNHGFSHSQRLEAAARSISDALDIDLDVVTVDVPAGSSPEARAREARYSAFAGAVRSAEILLTAHTLDDDAETVLLNLIRGTGTRGLAGIPRWRPPSIARPALDVRRAEMREIAALARLPYYDDPMNADLGLTRNWIRAIVIPELETANPRLRESLHRSAQFVEAESAVIEDMARSTKLQLRDGGARVATGQLLTLPEAVASRILIRMIDHVSGATAISADRVSRMWSVARGESTSQEIGGGAVAESVGPMLVLRVKAGLEAPPAQVLEPGLQILGNLEFEVLVMQRSSAVIPLSPWVATFPSGTELVARAGGIVTANGEEAWIVGKKRLPVAWYEPGTVGYLSVTAREGTGWTSSL